MGRSRSREKEDGARVGSWAHAAVARFLGRRRHRHRIIAFWEEEKRKQRRSEEMKGKQKDERKKKKKKKRLQSRCYNHRMMIKKHA